MNMINMEVFTLKDSLRFPIHYVQGTDSIPIKFLFQDYDILSGTEARVYVEKPSTKAIYASATVDVADDSVMVQMDKQMVAEPGLAKLQLELRQGETTLYTTVFDLLVQKSLVTIDSVSGSSFLDEYIDRINELVTLALNKAEAEASNALEQANYAKEQGDYAKKQGDHAKLQGDYAKEQGDYAKKQGDNTAEVIKESRLQTRESAAATEKSIKQTQECKEATQAALDAATGHSIIYDPSDGQKESIQDTVNHMWTEILKLIGSPLTVAEFDALGLTVAEFDARNITVKDFDMRAGAILSK